MHHRTLVILAYSSVVFALVWGIGIVPAVMVLRATKTTAQDMSSKTKRDLRGARVIAFGGLVLNSIVIAVVIWSAISNLL